MQSVHSGSLGPVVLLLHTTNKHMQNCQRPMKLRIQRVLYSKQPGHRGPRFDFTLQRPLVIQWNNGMVEYWNIGYKKRILS